MWAPPCHFYLHRNVQDAELADMFSTVRSRRARKLPVVLSPEVTRAVLGELSGLRRLMLELIYGADLRLSELVLLHTSLSEITLSPCFCVARRLH